MSRYVALILSAAVFLGAGVPAVEAAPADSQASPVAKKAKKKRKAIRCKKSQVPIKVGRRTVGCRSRSAALPPPREGDERLLLSKAVLDDDLGGLRDRRGRKPPSLKKLLRKVGPRAYRTVQAAIPEGFARLDGLAGTPVKRFLPDALGRQMANCGSGPSPTRSETYTSGGATATVTLGPVAGLDLTLDGRGYRVSVSFTSDECSHFDGPDCPTAAGVMDATDQSSFKASVSVAQGNTVLMSRTAAFTGRTRMHAQVGDDAKLELIDIDDTQTANIDLGGSRQEFGPVNLLYTGVHHARVPMPSGPYRPDQSAVDIALTLRGVTVGRSDLGQAGNNIAADLDKAFAALVDREIANFKSRETAWGNAPYPCVDLRFSPAANTLELRRGDQGAVSAQAVAKEGGAASGRWKLSGQQNATFTPEAAEGSEPRFSYDVTGAGFDKIVGATVRVTSKAGVAEASWTQPTKSDEEPLYYGEVSGSVSVTGDSCGEHWEWSYSAGLQGFEGAPFAIAGDGGAYAVNESGGGNYVFPPCNGESGCSTALAPDSTSPPGAVLFYVQGDTVEVEVTTVEYRGGPNYPCGIRAGGRLANGRFPLSMVGARRSP